VIWVPQEMSPRASPSPRAPPGVPDAPDAVARGRHTTLEALDLQGVNAVLVWPLLARTYAECPPCDETHAHPQPQKACGAMRVKTL
jgi:hypothetical protein